MLELSILTFTSKYLVNLILLVAQDQTSKIEILRFYQRCLEKYGHVRSKYEFLNLCINTRDGNHKEFNGF